jgi:myo-inositol 2-dehydrogenase/D-chiro-inositol 1-dehydrogenase
MQHFTDCVAHDEEPMIAGEDGRVVLEVILAAYQSAGTGRAVELPFTPPKVDQPIDLWHGTGS